MRYRTPGGSGLQVSELFLGAMRSRTVHPVVGATRRKQIVDSLAGMDLGLPPVAPTRLDTASGFFADFVRDDS